MDAFVKEFLPMIKPILSPKPIGIMDSDYKTCADHLKHLGQYVRGHKNLLSNFQEETKFNTVKMFYSVFEIVDFFGMKNRQKEVQIETYLFAMEFISVFGIMYRYFLVNIPGTEIFYSHLRSLDDRYFLYENLLPEMNLKTNEICSIVKSKSEPMMVNMTICKFISSITRIIINHQVQLAEDGQTDRIQKPMEAVLICIAEFFATTEKGKIGSDLINTVSELVYRLDLSPKIFTDFKYLVDKIIPFIVPLQRSKQIGRTHLRIAVISCELDFRQVLMALRCYQFAQVVELCEFTLLRLEMNSFFTSGHDGIGFMCFAGFTEIFNQIANEILLIFENICLWSYKGAIEAAEMTMKVFVNFFNLPAKKGWNGPWIALNERSIKVINTLASLNNSETISKLFNQ